MLWSGLTSFLMSPYTMHGSQADTTRARTLGFSYTGYPELRICSTPPPASLMIPVLYAKVERKHQKRTVLFDSVAPDFWSGYTQFLQSEESGSKESDILWSGWNCIFARMYFRSDNFCATVAECDPAHMHLKK